MRTWRGWRRRKLETGPSGTTKPSTSLPVWDSALGLAMFGDSLTCVKAMEEVRSDENGKGRPYGRDVLRETMM